VRWLLIVIGVVGILLGGVWTLQGLDVLGGSVMSGKPLWAVLGPVLAVVGLITLVLGVRRRDSGS
jgi:hypothetical protein